MKRFRRLLAYTFLSHFLIPFGAGHGGGIIGLLEIVTFPYFPDIAFTWGNSSAELDKVMSAIGLFGTIGNLLLLLAAVTSKEKIRMLLHGAGLLFYWVSVLYLLGADPLIKTSAFFFLPLLLMTVLPFMLRRITWPRGWFRN